MAPGYVPSQFFDELKSRLEQRGITAARFQKFDKIRDKGVTDQIAASVPVTTKQFMKYIDQKPDRDEFEGIWADDQSQYTLGLVRDPNDVIPTVIN